ncbi:MAG: hypothetical protein M1826_005732 [Phylliscum demangeonii]|nr:MAG: hypothetical protein M1826_005732 [Phylliscum demangeonii]
MSIMKRTGSPEEGRISPPLLRRKVQASISKSTMTNFFTPTSLKPVEKMRWQVKHQTLLVARYSTESPAADGEIPLTARQKVAAFDLDWTVIRTASGKRHARDEADWTWWHPTVPTAIAELYGKGYKVVIMSNQAGLNLHPNPKSFKGDMKRLAVFKQKVAAILAQLDLPITLYAATGQDQYRKPRVGMWEEMLADYHLLGPDMVDLAASFFVGDAGGRLAEDGGEKDHAYSDRGLAGNLAIGFHTPEEFFLHEPPRAYVERFNPKVYLSPATAEPVVPDAPAGFVMRNKLDIVLFCGSPGAGKSTFFWNHLEPLGYARVNQDILKSLGNCLKTAAKHLEQGIPVAVDNTNAFPETRAKWIELAHRFAVPIRCMLFSAPLDLCRHNNVVRGLNGNAMNPEQRDLLPPAAFQRHTARYRPPQLKDGYQDIVQVDFQFHGTDEQRALWSRHWIG